MSRFEKMREDLDTAEAAIEELRQALNFFEEDVNNVGTVVDAFDFEEYLATARGGLSDFEETAKEFA